MSQVTRTSRIERVKRPAWALEADLYVPTGDKEAAFGFPAFGPNNYSTIVRQALDNKQRLPTGEQTAFMLDEVYNSDVPGIKNSPEAQFVRDTIMKDRWLWVPVVNVWTPISDKNAGLYGVHDENGQWYSKVYTLEELEDRLSGGKTERGVKFSQDRKIAFASGNLIAGFGEENERHHEKGTLHKDGAFLVGYDIEGAQKLDNVGKVFTYKPRSWIVVNKTDKPVQSLSTLEWSRYLDDGRLYASFDADDDYGYGYVVSVSGSSPSAEGTAPKK